MSFIKEMKLQGGIRVKLLQAWKKNEFLKNHTCNLLQRKKGGEEESVPDPPTASDAEFGASLSFIQNQHSETSTEIPSYSLL